MKPARKPNGGKYKKGTALTIQGVLDQIGSCLEQSEAWISTNIHTACRRHDHAEALLELLEVNLCGSCGGFGPGQKTEDQRNLTTRWQWLVKYYTSKGEYK